MQTITEYYESYDEDSRLRDSKAKQTEFITTTIFLNRYLKDNSRILEVGAGTGIYSFYYALKGHRVAAMDLTPKHVELMKSKLSEYGHIHMDITQGNATDLSGFPNDHFDTVLCLGPMYHLISKIEQRRCIEECLRVVKSGGFVAIAYIPRYFVFPYLVKGDRKFLTEDWASRIVEKGFTSSEEKDCFWTDAYFHTAEEISQLMDDYGTEMVEHVATDGLAPLMGDLINDLSDEEYEAWLNYHLKTCNQPSVLGATNHALYICRKIEEPRGE